ncbi:unnamed protein product, partial [Iphiclides podalirius]
MPRCYRGRLIPALLPPRLATRRCVCEIITTRADKFGEIYQPARILECFPDKTRLFSLSILSSIGSSHGGVMTMSPYEVRANILPQLIPQPWLEKTFLCTDGVTPTDCQPTFSPIDGDAPRMRRVTSPIPNH